MAHPVSVGQGAIERRHANALDRIDLIRVAVSWSGGKDSALTVAELRAANDCEVVALITNIDERDDRVLAHRVRRESIEAQAASLGLPLIVVSLPPFPTNEIYEQRTLDVLDLLKTRLAVTHIAFGDLFLKDVRDYRERLTAVAELGALFPLWNRDTSGLANEFITQRFCARVIAVDTTQLDAGFVGREFDQSLLRDLPSGVDPCGEHGEFHTFVYDGPIFREPIRVICGDIDLSDARFASCDLRLVPTTV